MKGIGHICTIVILETPRGPGLPHSGVSASQRGNEAQDYRGEMDVPGIRTVVPNLREHY